MISRVTKKVKQKKREEKGKKVGGLGRGTGTENKGPPQLKGDKARHRELPKGNKYLAFGERHPLPNSNRRGEEDHIRKNTAGGTDLAGCQNVNK